MQMRRYTSLIIFILFTSASKIYSEAGFQICNFFFFNWTNYSTNKPEARPTSKVGLEPTGAPESNWKRAIEKLMDGTPIAVQHELKPRRHSKRGGEETTRIENKNNGR